MQTASEMAAALRAREVSAFELAEKAIARIEARDGAINAVVVRDFDRALDAARAADAALARGDAGALLGVPMTVKEAFNIAGLPTTWGLPGTKEIPVTRDAVVVARLKAAGAVILGKTNVPVMLGDWQSANPVYGVTNNPWDAARTAGGSSGGGTAAVAAGFTPLEFGSDMAGSLRVPASFCGVFAHRPSHGITPARGFFPPGVPVLSTAQAIDQSVLGPIARCAQDLALALDAVAGPDERETVGYQLRLPPPRHSSLADYRVLVIDEHPLTPTAGAVKGAVNQMARQLEAGGCAVGRASDALPDLTQIAALFVQLLGAMMSADSPEEAYEQARGAPKPTDPRDLSALSARAAALSHRDWLRLDRERVALAHQWRSLFETWDVLICPAAPTTAFTHDPRPFGERRITVDGASVPYGALPIWTSIPTPTGNPATAMPIGQDDAGLPIGMQIIGPHLEDHTTIAFAGLVEREFGGFVAPPGY